MMTFGLLSLFSKPAKPYIIYLFYKANIILSVGFYEQWLYFLFRISESLIDMAFPLQHQN